jgi:hypothetical protein
MNQDVKKAKFIEIWQFIETRIGGFDRLNLAAAPRTDGLAVSEPASVIRRLREERHG